MQVFSKELLMQSKKEKTIPFGCINPCGNFNQYFIVDGALYFSGESGGVYQVGSDTDWEHVMSTYNNGYQTVAAAIKGGSLYRVLNANNEPTPDFQIQQKDNTGTWTAISYSSSAGHFSGIKDGEIYTFSGTGNFSNITKLTTGYNDWEYIIGDPSESYFSFAIRKGYLYGFLSGSMSQIGSDDGWKMVSSDGYPAGGMGYGVYAIKNGYLYYIDDYSYSTTLVDNDNTWTYCSGSFMSNQYGIKNGVLYKLSSTSKTQVGSGNNWSAISTSMTSNSSLGYGIDDGKLYSINGTTLTQIGSNTNWIKVYGAGGTSSSYLNKRCGIALQDTGAVYIVKGNSSLTYVTTITL